jgi:hypothetical protein
MVTWSPDLRLCDVLMSFSNVELTAATQPPILAIAASATLSLICPPISKMETHQVHPVHQPHHTGQVHPSQRRVSCELCRKNKTKCQRSQPGDANCLRCTLNDLVCDFGQQRKVGRPKRKEDASYSPVDTSRHTKRRKQSLHLNSTRTTVKQFAAHNAFPHTSAGNLDVDESSTRVPAAERLPSHPHAGVSSLVSLAIQRTPASGWLEFPTFMTDRWCHDNIPGAARGGIVTDAEVGSPSDGSAAEPSVYASQAFPSRNAYDIPLSMLDTASQALFGCSLAWINPQLPIAPPLPYTHSLTVEKPPLPFGIGRPRAYYVHENKFFSDPCDVPTSNVGVDGERLMVTLARIAQGLRLRSAMVQANRSLLSLNCFIHREGPFFIESYSLCEYVMTSAQELLRIVAALLHCPQSAPKPDGRSPAYFIPTIKDIYCHILAFFQLFLEYLTDRAEKRDEHLVNPIPGLTFNGIILTGPCTQGVLFSSSSFYLLGRLETVLGIGSVSGGTGLLSTEQVDVLFDKIDRGEDLARGKGIMRPAVTECMNPSCSESSHLEATT